MDELLLVHDRRILLLWLVAGRLVAHLLHTVLLYLVSGLLHLMLLRVVHVRVAHGRVVHGWIVHIRRVHVAGHLAVAHLVLLVLGEHSALHVAHHLIGRLIATVAGRRVGTRLVGLHTWKRMTVKNLN